MSGRRRAIEGYAFWDHARVGHLDSSIIVAQRQYLNSVGAGARVNWERFVLDAGLAIPLTRVGPFNTRPDPRLRVTLTTRLWPWKDYSHAPCPVPNAPPEPVQAARFRLHARDH